MGRRLKGGEKASFFIFVHLGVSGAIGGPGAVGRRSGKAGREGPFACALPLLGDLVLLAHAAQRAFTFLMKLL